MFRETITKPYVCIFVVPFEDAFRYKLSSSFLKYKLINAVFLLGRHPQRWSSNGLILAYINYLSTGYLRSKSKFKDGEGLFDTQVILTADWEIWCNKVYNPLKLSGVTPEPGPGYMSIVMIKC